MIGAAILFLSHPYIRAGDSEPIITMDARAGLIIIVLQCSQKTTETSLYKKISKRNLHVADVGMAQ